MKLRWYFFLSLLFLAGLTAGDFYFIHTPSLNFFLLSFIFFCVALFCAKRPILWLSALLLVHAIHWLFGAYFGRDIELFDLYLFVTHTDETIEGAWGMHALFLPPLAAAILVGALLVPMRRLEKEKRRCAPLLWVSFLALLWPAGGLVDKNPTKDASIHRQTPPMVRPLLMDVIVVIGESMACNEKIVRRFEKLGGYARCILSAAVNTDVSIPLLLSGLDNPARLRENDGHNLFALAHRNGFYTRFLSAQSRHNLRYIRPYLGLKQIDDYSDTPKPKRAPKYDMALLRGLQGLPDRPAFVVLHQMGQHAPYIFYPGPKNGALAERYAKSLDYSFAFYRTLIKTLETSGRPYVLIITSDHGEFRGQNSRWGHNAFAPEVYTVPFFIRFAADPWAWYDKIRSHGDLYRYIRYLLGYGARFVPLEPPYIVNGTMQSGEDGSIRVDAITR